MYYQKYDAFLSYARFDDEADNGKITEYGKKISTRVRGHLGQEFRIFQDSLSIFPSELWEDKIFKVLNDSSFLIAFITPNFFKSEYCKKEFQYFSQKENINHIIPIHHISCDHLKESVDWYGDVFKFQVEDWRNIRFQSLTSSYVEEKIDNLALLIARLRS